MATSDKQSVAQYDSQFTFFLEGSRYGVAL